MVARFTSDPLEVAELGQEEVAGDKFRADLIFYGVDHSGDSYQARVYLNAPDVDVSTGRDHPNYAGSFYIFGHGNCYGDEGHCLVPDDPRDPFDVRPPHPLAPYTEVVTITPALKSLVDVTKPGQTITVTVIAETPRERSNDVLKFDTVRLAFYT